MLLGLVSSPFPNSVFGLIHGVAVQSVDGFLFVGDNVSLAIKKLHYVNDGCIIFIIILFVFFCNVCFHIYFSA